MIYTHVAAGLLGAAVAAVGAWQVQGWRYGEREAQQQAAWAQQQSDAVAKALRMTELMSKRAQDATIQAEARAQNHARIAADLRAELDGMRGDFADVPARIAAASREAVNQYASTATAVFTECAARYSGLAAKADGHASDALMLREAWPAVQP